MQGVTLGIALLGAVLGIINTWKALDKDRVKIRVVPKIAFFACANNLILRNRDLERARVRRPKDAPEMLSIQVVNLSSFEVTVSDVGFGKVGQLRQFIFQPTLTNGKSLPYRLSPREAITALADPGAKLDPALLTKAVAYVKTDCGKVRYGTSPIFKEYAKNLRSIARKK
ncbi:MAG: hypothetical protein ABSB33_02915 [Tepidisphaeraceae bacterium]